MKLKLLQLIVFITLSTSSFGASMGMGMGGGCLPFSPCWCANNPGHSQCGPAVPINNELWVLLAAGLILGYYYFRKNTTISTS